MIFEGLRDCDLILSEMPTRRSIRRRRRGMIARAVALGLVMALGMAIGMAGVRSLLDWLIDERLLSLGEAEAILTFAAGVGAGVWLTEAQWRSAVEKRSGESTGGGAMTGTWLIYRADGTLVSRADTRQAAMNRVDKPWRPGRITIRHERTLEEWVRSFGSWFKTRAGDPVRRPPASPPDPVAPAADPEPAEEKWWQR